MVEKIQVNGFQKSNLFYPPIQLLSTIKSFDLKAIRKRYLDSKQLGNKSGSVARREVSLGGVVSLKLNQGVIEEASRLVNIKEPRGVDFINKTTALSSENKIFVQQENNLYTIENDWFSYIHTVKINPFNAHKVLIASSGFDMIFEFDFVSKTKTFDWCAWEHGLNLSTNPKTGEHLLLTRKPKEFDYLSKEKHKIKLIKNPKIDFLPTAMRAAFINSVAYHPLDENKIIATLFHKGHVIEIDRATGSYQVVIQGLKNPHGGSFMHNQYSATSTASGEVIIRTPSKQVVLNFTDLPGKSKELANRSWLQNSLFLSPSLLVVIDSNRTQFHILDIEKQLLDSIDYDQNWAVQDIIQTNDTNHSWINDLR